jgi:hypothetical protein
MLALGSLNIGRIPVTPMAMMQSSDCCVPDSATGGI